MGYFVGLMVNYSIKRAIKIVDKYSSKLDFIYLIQVKYCNLQFLNIG